MRKRATHLLLALFSGSAAVLAAVVAMERTSPGPLASVHGREPDLAGRSDCSACHGGLFSNMTDACLDCHDAIAAQLERHEGLHGVLPEADAARCAACHSEHHGPGFALVNVQSFARAGVPDPEQFEHRMIGFPMDGKHLELDCSECHPNAFDTVLASGERRYIGLDQDCAACHEDAHEGRMQVACAACHGQTAFTEPASIGHERFLPLVGGHADVACLECHAKEGTYSLDVLGTGEGRLRPRACLDCHESPHTQDFVAGVAALVEMQPAASCVECHAAEHLSFREEGLSVSPENHAVSGFPLEPPHAEVACVDCHASELDTFAARYPGRGKDQCSRCHEDPHGGQFATGPFAQGDCIVCHDRLEWEPHVFDVEDHARAALPLDGKHLEIACEECHVDPAAEEPRVFRGTPARCELCHADAHAGFFAPFLALAPQVALGECAQCHDTQSFGGVPDECFAHERWTGFPVLGAHEQGGCEVCHPIADAPDDTGRRFGRVADAFGPFTGCQTCHADPHAGEFDDDQRVVGGRAGCARCHDEASFRTLPHGFEHGAWTDFALAGAHAEAACTACHARLRRADEDGRTWARASGPGCGDCHQDPHAGQFQVAGRTDCARCHVSELASFLGFDHDRDSRFRLGEAHENVACAACHLPVTGDGREFVRYRPLGIECVDCHGVHEEVLLRQKPRRRG